MIKKTFFRVIPTLSKLKLLDNYFNITIKKNKKIDKKYYKYYISLIKQGRYLGIFPVNGVVKFVKVK